MKIVTLVHLGVFFVFLVVFLIRGVLYAQTPGGVSSTNLKAWFDAGVGVTISGGGVASWTDRAGGTDATQGVGARRPDLTTAGINYNNVLTFDGDNDYLDFADRIAASATSLSVYGVARQTNTNKDTWGLILCGQMDGTWTSGGYALHSNGTNTQKGFFVRHYLSYGRLFNVSNNEVFLASGNWNGIAANTVNVYKNGVLSGTASYAPGSVGDVGASYIGGQGLNYNFFGDIAELAIFEEGLNLTDHQKVQSYLGVKYSITLNHNYLSSSGTNIYTPAAPYNRDVIGIGRDDGSGLVQKQSRTQTDSVRLYISTLATSNAANTGTFGSDHSFVVMGSNNGLCQSTDVTKNEYPSGHGIIDRIEREWKVTNTNFSSTFSIQIRLGAGVYLSSVNASQLRLLVDDDGDFTSGCSVYEDGDMGITISYSDPVVTISGIPTGVIPANSTRFITLATLQGPPSLVSPGGVGGRSVLARTMRLWFDASTGVTLTMGAVSNWTDRAGVGDATQGTAAYRPLETSAGLNYNTVLTFDGSDDFLNYSNRVSSSATALAAYGVARQTTSTGVDTWGCILMGQTDWSSGGYGLHGADAGNTQKGFFVRHYSTIGRAFSIVNGDPFLIGGNWNGITTNTLRVYRNGASMASSTYAPGSVGSSSGASTIGGQGLNYNFNGAIAELIVFEDVIDATKHEKIQSYLGLKYGITLSHNYLSSSGTNIYTPSTPYNRDVIGIGRDDGSGLVQKQSRTQTDSVRLYISTLATTNAANTGTFGSDQSFVVMGSNNGQFYSVTHTAYEFPTGHGLIDRIEREWKITNTNFGETFSIQITLGTGAFTSSVNASQLRLLVDDDGDFSSGCSVYENGDMGITISYSDPVITLADIPVGIIPSNSTRYITIATIQPAPVVVAPGGVGGRSVLGRLLRVWFDASVGVTHTMGSVTSWSDRTSAGNATQTISGYRPVETLVGLNYNPTITFDGVDDHLSLVNRISPNATSLAMFAVANQVAKNLDTYGTIFNGQATSWTGGGYGFYGHDVSNNQKGFFVRNFSSFSGQISVSNNVPFLISGNWNGLVANSVRVFRNGSLTGSASFVPGSVGLGGNTFIGGQGTSYNFYGNISEVVVFEDGLDADKVNRVQTYLALKYGISLAHNYYSSSSVEIYNVSGGYNQTIIGIGRDDGSGLVQKQSKNPTDSVRIYLSTLASSNAANTGTFSSDNSFLVMGANGGAYYSGSTSFTEFPSGHGLIDRIEREWKLTNTNFGSTFSIDIRLGNGTFTSSVAASQLRLLVDDDGDFTGGCAVYASGDMGITISYSDPVITISNIPTGIIPSNSTRYITIATTQPAPTYTAPGGISGRSVLNKPIRAWFDASVGVTLSMGAVSNWTDRAGVGDASQSTAANRPLLTSAAINYNHTLTFDGLNDVLNYSDRINPDAQGLGVYAVARQTNTNRDPWGSILMGQQLNWTNGGYGLHGMNAGNTQKGFFVRHWSSYGAGFTIANNRTYLFGGNWNGLVSNSVRSFRDGTFISSNTYAPGSVGMPNAASTIGGDYTTGYCFYGDIAEVVIVEDILDNNKHQRIQSYLGIKYGLTLGHNYLSSSSTTLYDVSSYNNRIIGLGRDDASGLQQKQSATADDSIRIYLSALAASNDANTGTFSSDQSFVIMGDNGAVICTNPTSALDMPAGHGLFDRVAREWKLTNTNFSETFSIDIRLSPCAIPASVTVSDLRFIVDDDGDFTTGTTSVIASGSMGITISYSAPLLTISGLSTAVFPSNTTKFFTIGTVSSSTPLPVLLVHFDAQLVEDKTVKLSWATISEINNDYFIIEKGKNPNKEEFHFLLKKPGFGNSNQLIEYEEFDPNPFVGDNYYLLKQVDKDGKMSDLGVRYVNFESWGDVMLTYHQGVYKLNFVNTKIGAHHVPRLYNSLGQILGENQVISVQNSQLVVDLRGLPKGIYLLEYGSRNFKLLNEW